MYRLGTALMGKRSYNDAALQFKKMISLFPESSLKEKAYFQLGNCRFNQEDYKGALQIFNDITVRSPDSDTGRYAKYQMAWCYFKMRKEKEALAEFEDYLKRYPDSDFTANVYYGLGEYYFNRGRYEKARSYLTVIPEKFSDNALAVHARFMASTAFEREGDLWASAEQAKLLAREHPKTGIAATGMVKAVDFMISPREVRRSSCGAFEAY